jgi:hypothetical protein
LAGSYGVVLGHMISVAISGDGRLSKKHDRK